jgi:hypothetical protein
MRRQGIGVAERSLRLAVSGWRLGSKKETGIRVAGGGSIPLKGKPETGGLAWGINIRGIHSGFPLCRCLSNPYPYPFAIVSAPFLR